MTLEQRKLELINWISRLEDESCLFRIEELKNDSIADLPSELFQVLAKSASYPSSRYMKHTSVSNFKRT